MEHRIAKKGLLNQLGQWDGFLKRKVHLIACGGTALTLFKEFSHIYLGILNYYDLITSKLFRGTSVDIDDSLMLLKSKRNEININQLKKHYEETAKYEIAQDKVIKYLENFMDILKKEGLI